MKTIAKALADLEHYGELEDGWHEGEGKAPKPAHLELAKKFINGLPETVDAPSAMIGSGGTVGFYWNVPPCYIDLEIEEDDTFSILISYRQHKNPNVRTRDAWYPGVLCGTGRSRLHGICVTLDDGAEPCLIRASTGCEAKTRSIAKPRQWPRQTYRSRKKMFGPEHVLWRIRKPITQRAAVGGTKNDERR